ncbi:MAG: methylisocitrate lyase [Deinococcota bacterium]
MLFTDTTPEQKRAAFRQGLDSGKLLRFPGAFSPLVAMLLAEQGFDGIYISGAVLANDLGLPDIGLTTLPEISQRGRQIARVTSLPSIIDIDTGFGEPMNVVRTVLELQELGLAGCHLEDQENPKRCGHLDHKQLVDVPTMTRKINAAANAKRDPNFMLIARTDARASEGLDAAIDRAKAYVDAGADMIFPEAMQDEHEFEAFRKSVNVPILANMTEFGKSKLLDVATLESLGINLVIYPVTSLRLAMHAVETAFTDIKQTGTQAHLLDQMQPRSRLYELLRYEDYNEFDQNVFNFSLTKAQ